MAAAIHPVTMPKWGIEMTEGTLTQWSVGEGARVNKGDPLLEVETDKIVNTVESPAAGCLRRIIAGTGETMAVGALIGILAEESVSDSEINSFIASFKGANVSFEPDENAAGPPAPQEPAVAAQGTVREEVRVSPIARRLAESLGVDISKVTGTGRNGRISKEDVEGYAANLQAQGGLSSSRPPGPHSQDSPMPTAGQTLPARGESQANPFTSGKMSAMRSAIAKRLLESKQTIPHYRIVMDVRIDRLRARREELSRSAGQKLTLNDMLVRAAALALVKHPSVNSQFDGEEIRQYAHADIAVAVATDTGLVTPIVRCADVKSLSEIGRMTAELAQKAKSGTLTREDISGGTFTISNLGMFGVTHFDAIINPPQVAILAVGAGSERIVARDGAPTVAWMMTLTLSADHRVVDGAVAAAFLATLAGLVQAPEEL